jgi:hypothetical protein
MLIDHKIPNHMPFLILTATQYSVFKCIVGDRLLGSSQMKLQTIALHTDTAMFRDLTRFSGA